LVEVDQPDFTTVTETPDTNASQSELSQIYTRYKWAGEYVTGRRILEVACGSGPGLGYLLKKGAVEVVGTDIEELNLRFARDYYAANPSISLEILDAMSMRYENESFDVVINFEAIYYMSNLKVAVKEAFRVLKPGGYLLISTVNSDWKGFNPSPYSHWYPNAEQLKALLTEYGFKVQIRLGFHDRPSGPVSCLKSLIRRYAIRLKLIPNTMKGKELLKRIFYGRLSPIPNELDDESYSAEALMPLAEVDSESSNYMFIYVEAMKPK